MSGGLFIEACCPSLEAVSKACALGFSRIELCERLEVGGVTPSPELLREAIAFSSLPVRVLVRPRGGNFVYNESEAAVMAREISLCADLGASGVVIGALTPGGMVDFAVMGPLMALAREKGLGATFHRAFDECSDPPAVLEQVISLGCDRLLTSGCAPTAPEGKELIASLVRQASGRIAVMAGSGVRPGNIGLLRKATLAPEYHSSFLSADYWATSQNR